MIVNVYTKTPGGVSQLAKESGGNLAAIASIDFATEATLTALGLRLASRKLGTDGQVLGVASAAVRSAQLDAETLWELSTDAPIWYRQGDVTTVAVAGGAGCAYLPAGERKLIVITGATDDYVSIVAATAPGTTFETAAELLNRLKVDYEAHRVSTPSVHAHADASNDVTSADATDLASAITLANEIKADYNAHRTELSLLEESIAVLNELKGDYNAHRVLIAGGVHGAADNTNVVDAADASNLATAITLANQIATMYEAHRILTDGGVHGAADSVDAITAGAASDVVSVAAIALDLKTQYEAHRVLIAGGVHGAADAVNDVTSDDPGTADVHRTDDVTNPVAAADASDLASLKTLVAELWSDYNAHLANLAGGSHGTLDSANLLTWGVASLTLEE